MYLVESEKGLLKDLRKFALRVNEKRFNETLGILGDLYEESGDSKVTICRKHWSISKDNFTYYSYKRVWIRFEVEGIDPRNFMVLPYKNHPNLYEFLFFPPQNLVVGCFDRGFNGFVWLRQERTFDTFKDPPIDFHKTFFK